MVKRILSLLVVSVFCSCFSLAFGADRGPINPGETKIGIGIAGPSYMDTWTFQGTAGQRVVINAVTTAGSLNTSITLYPQGEQAEASSLTGDKLDWQLKKTRLYTVVIQDYWISGAGIYNLSFLTMPGPVNYSEDLDGGPIASGRTLSATINVASDMDAFQFLGSAGQRVVINAVTTAGSSNTSITLYPPSGGPAEASSLTGDKLDWQLKQTGLYTVVIQDYWLNGAGTYNLTFLTMLGSVNYSGDLDGGLIDSGGTLSGTINASDMDAFYFYGNVNDRAIINAVTTAGTLNTSITLYPPSGGPAEASSLTGDKLDWELKQTGLYTVVIQDYWLSGAGTYDISMSKIPSDLRDGIYRPSPENGADVCNFGDSFSWDAVAGATGYDVWFKDNVLTPPIKICNNVSSPSCPFPSMDNGKVYYWRAIAHTPEAYRPISIDSHVINNTAYFNSAWVYDPDASWGTWYGTSADQFPQFFIAKAAEGNRLISVDSYVISNVLYYASVWLYDPNSSLDSSWTARGEQTATEYQQTFDQLTSQGYRLIDVDTHVINNVAYYASVWIYDPGSSWTARKGQTATEYQQAFDQFTSQGYRLIDVDTHVINNVAYYASVWIYDPGSSWTARKGQTATEYQQTVAQLSSQGYRPIRIDAHVINNVPYYASVWLYDPNITWQEEHGQTGAEYSETVNQVLSEGNIQGPVLWFATCSSVTRTLSVASSNPSSSVSVTVSPADNNGAGNGTTPFGRTYNNNASVTLTAPSPAGGNNFQKWQQDGVDLSTNLSVQVAMDANHTLTAVYMTTAAELEIRYLGIAGDPDTLVAGCRVRQDFVAVAVGPPGDLPGVSGQMFLDGLSIGGVRLNPVSAPPAGVGTLPPGQIYSGQVQIRARVPGLLTATFVATDRLRHASAPVSLEVPVVQNSAPVIQSMEPLSVDTFPVGVKYSLVVKAHLTDDCRVAGAWVEVDYGNGRGFRPVGSLRDDGRSPDSAAHDDDWAGIAQIQFLRPGTYPLRLAVQDDHRFVAYSSPVPITAQ